MLDIYEYNKTISEILLNYKSGKFLLIFDHGLGDIILFLNLFEILRKQNKHLDLYIGCYEKLNYGYLHKKIVNLKLQNNKEYNQQINFSRIDARIKYDIKKLESEYIQIFNIKFKETTETKKLILCAQKELGIDINNINCHQYKIKYNKSNEIDNNKKVIVHLTSNTAPALKGLRENEAENLWNCLKQKGYDPYLIHNSFNLSNKQYIDVSYKFIPHDKIYKSHDNLPELIDLIANSKLFFGVASGPICIAHNILRDKKCFFLQKCKPTIEHYILNTKMKFITQYDINYLNNNIL